MYYYRKGNTYIASLTEVSEAEEISAEEFNRIKAIIDNPPIAPDGFGCRLTSGLEWELYQLPDESEAELTAEEALEIVLGGAV